MRRLCSAAGLVLVLIGCRSPEVVETPAPSQPIVHRPVPVSRLPRDYRPPPTPAALAGWSLPEPSTPTDIASEPVAAMQPVSHQMPAPPSPSWGYSLPQPPIVPPAPPADSAYTVPAIPPAAASYAGPVEPALSPAVGEFGLPPSGHMILPGDELEIRFPFRPLFNQRMMVREDGVITVPLLGPVIAAGKTPDQLQQELAERYRPLAYDASRPGEKQYLISVNDKLEIRFAAHPEFSDIVPVRPDGRITLPLVRSVVAEGKTPEQLATELRDRFAAFVKDPELVVIVREFTSDLVYVDGQMTRAGVKDIDQVIVLTPVYERLVFVTGEVGTPGFVRYRGPLTALQAIASVGGVKRSARLDEVILLRKGIPCQPVAMRLDLEADFRGEGCCDVPLQPYDVLIVPKTHITRLNDCMEQYVYQLLPITRNSSFSYIYSASNSTSILTF